MPMRSTRSPSTRRLQTLLTARAGRDRATILTPHPLEAARLLGTTTQAVQADRLGAALALAERYRATVVLKGSGSVIAAPGRRAADQRHRQRLARHRRHRRRARRLDRRSLAPRRRRPFDAATLGVVEHGAAAEPAQAGALRAADLIERLYRRVREG